MLRGTKGCPGNAGCRNAMLEVYGRESPRTLAFNAAQYKSHEADDRLPVKVD